LVTFFAAAKKVTPAPGRGKPSKPKANQASWQAHAPDGVHRPLSPKNPQQQRSQKNNNKDKKQDLGDLSRASGDSTEPKKRRNQRDDEKNNGISEHGNPRKLVSRGTRQKQPMCPAKAPKKLQNSPVAAGTHPLAWNAKTPHHLAAHAALRGAPRALTREKRKPA
jgi:hypothetical protein